MRVDTEKLQSMQRRRESLHSAFVTVQREWEETRAALGQARNRNPEVNSHGYKQEVLRSALEQIARLEREVERLQAERDDAADQWRQYAESIQASLDWVEDRMKQPGFRPVMPTVGDGQ